MTGFSVVRQQSGVYILDRYRVFPLPANTQAHKSCFYIGLGCQPTDEMTLIYHLYYIHTARICQQVFCEKIYSYPIIHRYLKYVPSWDTFFAFFAILREGIAAMRFLRLTISLGYMPYVQLNRAIRYILCRGSRAVGAPGYSHTSVWMERETPALQVTCDKGAGHDLGTGTMILALATRHRVERPAIRMGGGT